MVEKGLWADRRDTVWMAVSTAEFQGNTYGRVTPSRVAVEDKQINNNENTANR